MKRFIKIIAVIAAAAILCASLCSCTALDEAKRTTAYFTDDTKEALTFRDSKYLLIDTPDTGVHFLINDAVSGYHACTSDIPILLASQYANVMIFRKSEKDDPRFVAVLNDNYTDYSYEFSTDYKDTDYVFRDNKKYYVREDAMDEISDLLDNAVCDHYCIFVYDYGYEYYEGEGMSVPQMTGNILLHDDAIAAVDRTMTGKKQVKWADLDMNYDWYSTDIVSCDSTMTVTDKRIYCLVTNGTDFYLHEYGSMSAPLYQVAKSDYEAMKAVYDMCRDSMDYIYPDEHMDAEVVLES